jgi:hypothetical protein
MIINDGIQGEIGSDIPLPATIGNLLQVIQGEIDRGSRAHVQLLNSKVHRVSTIVQRGLQGFKISSRGHQFNRILAVDYHFVLFSELQKYNIFQKSHPVKNYQWLGEIEIF